MCFQPRAGLFGDLVEADCPTGVRFSIGISLRKPLNAILMRSSTMRRMPKTSLVGLYAKLGRTRVLSSRSVVHSAEHIAKKTMDTYLEPDRASLNSATWPNLDRSTSCTNSAT